MPLIDTEKAWKTAQRIYSDPVLLHAIKNTLDATETEDAAPVGHGRRIPPDGNAHIMYQCSVCGHTGFSHMKYCLNCGARMDGDGNA